MNKTVKSLLINTLIVALKDVPGLLISKAREQLITSATIYKGTGLFDIFEQWLYGNYKHKFKDIEISKGAFEDYPSEPGGSRRKVSDLNFGLKQGYFTIKYKSKRVTVNKSKLAMNSNNRVFLDYYTLSSFDKTVVTTLLQDINALYDETNTKIQLYTSNEWGEWLHMSDIKPKALDSVILDKDKKDDLLKDVANFVNDKDWYHSVGIDYNRGYLFHGPPGNGKTSLSIALGQHFKKDIYAIDLASIGSDIYLKNAFKRIPFNTILLIEDVDKAFAERDNVEAKGITFSCLLNCLNGVFQKEGLVTIMTTNHIENLDPALIRSGRIDYKLEISNPDAEAISDYLSRFYKETIQIAKHNTISMADVQDICIRNRNDVHAAINEIR